MNRLMKMIIVCAMYFILNGCIFSWSVIVGGLVVGTGVEYVINHRNDYHEETLRTDENYEILSASQKYDAEKWHKARMKLIKKTNINRGE